MKYIMTMICGYLVGTISPSAFISKIKGKDIRQSGTGNLGATNVLLNFGKALGVLVMLFDIGKSFAVVKITAQIFHDNTILPLLAGASAVFGHIFPFYMKFKGGKGLAAYGGFVLAVDPVVFLVLITIALIMMLIVNYSFVTPFIGGLAFPIIMVVKTKSLLVFLVTAVAGGVIIWKHFGNFKKALRKEDVQVRAMVKSFFVKKKI